jgi:hypothetical protein
MDKGAIENEVRLYAVEWLCASTTAMLLRASGDGEFLLSDLRKQAREGPRRHNLASDPVLSDHLSAELGSALDRLLQMTEYYLGKRQSHEVKDIP